MKLSPQLEKVAQYAMQGYTQAQTAKAMRLSINTAKGYRKRLYAYLGVCSVAQLRKRMGFEFAPVQAAMKRDVYVAYRRQGMSCKQIALMFGISDQSVKQMTRGRV